MSDKNNTDGVLDEACWKLNELIQKLAVGDTTSIKASFDIVHTDCDIYMAVKVIDPDRHLKLGDPAEENLPFEDDSQGVWRGTARNDRLSQFGTVILETKNEK